MKLARRLIRADDRLGSDVALKKRERRECTPVKKDGIAEPVRVAWGDNRRARSAPGIGQSVDDAGIDAGLVAKKKHGCLGLYRQRLEARSDGRTLPKRRIRILHDSNAEIPKSRRHGLRLVANDNKHLVQ